MHASPALTEQQPQTSAGGQPVAFEQLYRDYHVRIYNLTARIVGDREDAADITQEVFLRAYTHPPDLRDGHLSLGPWLYRIAVNASYDHLRRRAARPATPLDAVPEIAAAGDGFAHAEIARTVEGCLAGLTPRYRTALVLKDLHGLSNAEIAQIMDVHQGTVRVLLHRARTAFRRAFRSTAPESAGGVSALGLAAFLPDLPVPASLQAPPWAGAVPPASGPAGTPPDLTGSAAPLGGAPAAIPVAAAPIAPAGLLASLGGAVGAKVAIVAIAAVAATGGGLAARHAASTSPIDDTAASQGRTAVTVPVVAPADSSSTHRELVRERLRSAGLTSPNGGGTGSPGVQSRNGQTESGGAQTRTGHGHGDSSGAVKGGGGGPGGNDASGPAASGTNQGGTNQGGTNQGGTNQGGTNQGGTGSGAGTGAGGGSVEPPVDGGSTGSGAGSGEPGGGPGPGGGS